MDEQEKHVTLKSMMFPARPYDKAGTTLVRYIVPIIADIPSQVSKSPTVMAK